MTLSNVDLSWGSHLAKVLGRRGGRPFLLQAPLTRRMACLTQLVAEVIARDQAALVVTGETAWASWMARQLQRQLGGRLLLFHSGLSAHEKADARARMVSRSVRLVVGTRSAIFAPLPALGLLWIDGEEDPSLKEEQEPHYHARDIAQFRAQQEGALCVFGSGHPLLETQHHVPSIEDTWVPPVSQEGGPMVELVDLRRFPSGTLLTPPMLDGIRQALDRLAGAILFLNRKGYAGALVCRDCGEIPRCPQCSVAFTYHRQAGRLECRYCGHHLALPDICPTCTAPRLEPVGFGTERVEEEIRRAFPKARIARYDRDAIRRASQGRALKQLLWDGEIDILIGTQMLFQQGPLPRVGFVGVPFADVGFHAPDFRAAERTCHALLDAVDLARPASQSGKVILQTLLPGHHAIQAVLTGNPALFADVELGFRAALGYPPYAHLVALQVSGKQAGQVEAAARRWAALLKTETEVLSAAAEPLTGQRAAPLHVGITSGAMVLGPVPAPLSRLRGTYRWDILVRSVQRELARRVVRATLEKIESQYKRGTLRFDVDVDPVATG